MSHDPSRKHFLAKLIGLFAVIGIAPKLLAKPATATAPAESGFRLQTDTRAVSRQADTL